MTGMDIRPGMAPRGGGAVRRVHFHDPDAPAATVVVPSVFVAVREERGA